MHFLFFMTIFEHEYRPKKNNCRNPRTQLMSVVKKKKRLFHCLEKLTTILVTVEQHIYIFDIFRTVRHGKSYQISAEPPGSSCITKLYSTRHKRLLTRNLQTFTCVPVISFTVNIFTAKGQIFHFVTLNALIFGRLISLIIWLFLTRTGNYRIHDFDWLKSAAQQGPAEMEIDRSLDFAIQTGILRWPTSITAKVNTRENEVSSPHFLLVNTTQLKKERQH